MLHLAKNGDCSLMTGLTIYSITRCERIVECVQENPDGPEEEGRMVNHHPLSGKECQKCICRSGHLDGKFCTL